ncbi:MAG: hypothetical protein ABIB47_05515 [Candidatus Woesearchaeota archaeon]
MLKSLLNTRLGRGCAIGVASIAASWNISGCPPSARFETEDNGDTIETIENIIEEAIGEVTDDDPIIDWDGKRPRPDNSISEEDCLLAREVYHEFNRELQYGNDHAVEVARELYEENPLRSLSFLLDIYVLNSTGLIDIARAADWMIQGLDEILPCELYDGGSEGCDVRWKDQNNSYGWNPPTGWDHISSSGTNLWRPDDFSTNRQEIQHNALPTRFSNIEDLIDRELRDAIEIYRREPFVLSSGQIGVLSEWRDDFFRFKAIDVIVDGTLYGITAIPENFGSVSREADVAIKSLCVWKEGDVPDGGGDGPSSSGDPYVDELGYFRQASNQSSGLGAPDGTYAVLEAPGFNVLVMTYLFTDNTPKNGPGDDILIHYGSVEAERGFHISVHFRTERSILERIITGGSHIFEIDNLNRNGGRLSLDMGNVILGPSETPGVTIGIWDDSYSGTSKFRIDAIESIYNE